MRRPSRILRRHWALRLLARVVRRGLCRHLVLRPNRGAAVRSPQHDPHPRPEVAPTPCVGAMLRQVLHCVLTARSLRVCAWHRCVPPVAANTTWGDRFFADCQFLIAASDTSPESHTAVRGVLLHRHRIHSS